MQPLGIANEALNPVLHEAGYLSGNSNWNFPAVLSPFWRVYYNFDVGHCILLDDECYELLPDRLYLIPDHILFHCLGQQPVRHFWLNFSMLNKVDSSQSVPIVLEPQGNESVLIGSIASHIENYSDHLGLKTIYHESMSLLHLLFSRAGISWKPPFPERFTKLLEFIDDHAHETIPNQRLAEQSGMSVISLCRTFQSHMHTTPAHYVNQVRISKAGHLLEHTEQGVDEIADVTGFPNRAYFSRVFKKMTSLSPAEFRMRKKSHYLMFGQ